MGLIKVILIILFIYYAFKFLVRLFGPMLMKKAMDKMKEKAAQQFGGAQEDTTIREGETIIDKKPSQNKKNRGDVGGDYVEFEEID